MDKFQAYQAFWASFGLPAYDENSVPYGRNAPEGDYITYNLQFDTFNRPVSLNADIWTLSTSWKRVLDIFDRVFRRIDTGVYVPYDGGAILIRFESPIMTRLGDPDDENVKRISMNIGAEFIPAD